MDATLDDIIRGLIRAERSRRRIPAAMAMAQVAEEVPAGHSYRPIALDRKAAHEYEARAKYALTVAVRAVNEAALAWTSERATEVSQLLQTELVFDWDELVDLLRKKDRGGKGPRIDELEAAKNRCQSESAHELSLLVYSQDRSRIPVAEQLSAPRYQAVLPAWHKAHTLADQSAPDYPNAAKEAVNAVEQLARIVTGKPTATLGDAIKDLRTTGRVQAPLLKGIEELWGWTSGTPGVRHGSSNMLIVDAPTAGYILAQADAALSLLLAADAA